MFDRCWHPIQLVASKRPVQGMILRMEIDIVQKYRFRHGLPIAYQKVGWTLFIEVLILDIVDVVFL